MPDKRCAVVLGVDRIKALAPLQHAASGAARFAAWAEQQGIDVMLLTDADGGTVTLAAVKQAVKAYVEKRIYQQIIVFFSGHGILIAPDSEVWLLSEAPEDPDEAIVVPGSIFLARNAGIPHVVVISDACRSRPDGTRMSQMSGGRIFPCEVPKIPRPAVDVFYATLPGDPAYELSGEAAVANFGSIFTDHALKGLSGEVPEIIERVAGPLAPRHVVTSRKLKSYLESEVPAAAAAVNIALHQYPDIRVESDGNSVLADLPAPPGACSGELAGYLLRFPMLYSSGHNSFLESMSLTPTKPRRVSPPLRQLDARGSIQAMVEKARGKPSATTGTGFTIVGTEVARACVDAGRCDVFRERGAVQISVVSSIKGSPRSVAIQFSDGNGVVLAVLPGYIGVVIVDDARVSTVNYVRSGGREGSALERVELETTRAYAAFVSRHSVLGMLSNVTAVIVFANLCSSFGFEPTLSLYTAYAYAQVGRFDLIESLHEKVVQFPVPVLFDVAMLAGRLPSRLNGRTLGIAPFCPMLTQGWALLADDESLPAPVRAARRHLVPGLWTTFTEEGFQVLWDAMTISGRSAK